MSPVAGAWRRPNDLKPQAGGAQTGQLADGIVMSDAVSEVGADLIPDPSQLPVADGSYTISGTYARSLNAGDSYLDPETGVRVVLIGEGGAYHDYANGGPYVSLAWESAGEDHVTVMYNNGSSYRFADIRLSDGVMTDERDAPNLEYDTSFCFSMDPTEPRICFYTSGGAIQRYNSQTNALANTGNFPHTPSNIGDWLNGVGGWVMGDITNTVFSWIDGNGNAGCVWNSDTDEELHVWDGQDNLINEAYLGRNGDYVVYSWDSGHADAGKMGFVRLSDETLLGTTGARIAHPSPSRTHLFGVDPDTAVGYTYRSYALTTPGSVAANFGSGGTISGGPCVNHECANWIHDNGEGLEGWVVTSFFTESAGVETAPGVAEGMICLYRQSDEAIRAVCWPDNNVDLNGDYFHQTHATISGDGRAIMFSTLRNGIGGAVCLAIMPTVEA